MSESGDNEWNRAITVSEFRYLQKPSKRSKYRGRFNLYSEAPRPRQPQEPQGRRSR